MNACWRSLLVLVLTVGCGGSHRTYDVSGRTAAASAVTSSSGPTPSPPPATTPPPPTLAASLEVSAQGPGPARIDADAVEVLGLAFTITNHGPDAADLNTLTVRAAGRLDDAVGITTLRLAEDTDGDGRYDRAIDRVLSSAGFAQDDGDANLGIHTSLQAGGTFRGLIVLDLSGSGRAGDGVRLLVDSPSRLDVTAPTGRTRVDLVPFAGPVLRVGGWVEPHVALSLPGDGLFPRAVRDAQGRTHLAVYQNYNGNSDVFYSLFDGRSYSPPDDVSRAGSAAWNHDLAVDAQGLPHLVWEEWDAAIGDFAIRFSRFDPAAFAWTPAAPVSVSAGMSVVPRIAIAKGGEVHVVWEDHASSPRILHRVLDHQGWSSIAEITSAAASAQPRNPALAALPTGDVLLTWAENAAGRSEIRTRRALASGGYGPLEVAASATQITERPELLQDGGTTHLVYVAGGEVFLTREAGQGWSQPVNVSRSPNVGSGMPTLAVQGGELHVVWIEADPTLPGLASHVAHAQTLGGSFTTPELLTRGPGDRSIPTAVGEGDRLRILWQDWSLGRQRVFTSWREDGPFEAPRLVARTRGDPSPPSASQGGAGDVSVGYSVDAGGNPEVFVCHEPKPGLGFDLPENVSRSPTPSYAPSLTEARGTTWVAWEEDTARGFEVRVSRRDPSGWSTPAAISSNTPAYSPSLAGSAHRLALVWSERSPGGDHDVVLRLHDGQAWGAREILDARPTSAWSPRAAWSDSGELAVAWQEDTAIREVLVATRTPAGTSVAAVASSSQSQFAPRVAYLENDLHVAWLEDGRVRVAKRPAGATVFDSPVDLTAGGAGSVDLGVSGDTLLVAWEQWQGGDARVLHAVLTPSGWSQPSPLDLSRGPSRRVSVLGAPTGGVRVLWTDGGDVVMRERREK